VGVYKLEVVKGLESSLNQVRWRNVYNLNTPTLNDAFSIADTIVNIEANIHSTNVTMLQKIVSDPTRVERRMAFSYAATHGSRVASGAIIPDWNVVGVTFFPASNPRPERKYYRVQLGEGDIVGSAIETTVVDIIQAQMDAMLGAVIALCAPNGDSVESAEVHSLVAMRQLNWHRRSRPGFRRGYVPV
jgi:ribosomal protein L24